MCTIRFNGHRRVCICLWVWGGGRRLPLDSRGCTPSWPDTPSQEETPLLADPLPDTPGGRQPWIDTLLIWADTPLPIAFWDIHPLPIACWDTPHGQNSWHMLMKTLPSHHFCCAVILIIFTHSGYFFWNVHFGQIYCTKTIQLRSTVSRKN